MKRLVAALDARPSTILCGDCWLLVAVLGMLYACPGVAQVTGPATQRTAARVVDQPALDTPAAIAPLRFDVVAGDVEHRIASLLERMTLREKIGQLVQVYPEDEKLSDELIAQIRRGEVGSIFYTADASLVQTAQQIATDESRLGIPLIVARDVIHGFRTVFPIPLGQAASWNPELVERASAIAAGEARSEGIDWTFAPMVDVCRDPRWGRIAETFGEDPLLSSDLAVAMVRGFQQEQAGKLQGIAACAKHFVGYGLSEGGRDYNRASVARADLHNIFLPPFRAAVDAGCRSIMTSFSEVNGVPGTAHGELIDGVLKREWEFAGVVVSDWASITEMIVHGFVPDEAAAAEAALMAGVDMDMCSPAFADHLQRLVETGRVPEARIDDAVRRVLRLKIELYPRRVCQEQDPLLRDDALEVARQLARESFVLLKNDGVLPLCRDAIQRLAVIGPLADEGKQQLGCWALDGRAEDSITPWNHLREALGNDVEVAYARGAENTFSADASLISEAVSVAERADVAVLFVGEDAVLSGEARSRAELDLPGVQRRLVAEVAATGTPVVLVVLAGRPLTIEPEVHAASAVLYAWHPGTMAGPAIGDVLFGAASPAGKLPITFPRSVGQIPLYYSHHNTGRPTPADYKPLIGSALDDLPQEFQYRSHYLDVAPLPLFPFGFGLSYVEFTYSDIELTSSNIKPHDVLGVRVRLTNAGAVAATEISQVYVRDRTASIVRPVRELKAYRRTHLQPGESVVLEFALPASSLSYFDNQGRRMLEPGEFDVWVGGDSTATLGATFRLAK